MQFELTKEYIEELKEQIDAGNTKAVSEAIADVHPADIAEIIQQFHEDDAFLFFGLIETEKRAEVFLELDEDWRKALLEDPELQRYCRPADQRHRLG